MRRTRAFAPLALAVIIAAALPGASAAPASPEGLAIALGLLTIGAAGLFAQSGRANRRRISRRDSQG